MELSFTKMHGAGNDFVLIDCRIIDPARYFALPDLAAQLCNRRFGIGADQLLLLYNSDSADFKMRIFNADGGEVEMCGNGIRCFAKYVWDKGLSTRDILRIDTLAGVIRPERAGKLVRVDMGEPVFEAEKIPVALKAASPIIDYPLQINGREFKITCVSMGNPHAVIFLDEDVAKFPVSIFGSAIEKHPIFPNRTNVEFVNVKSRKDLTMRVWERGSGETMACGTGATATGVAAMLKGLADRVVTIHLLGGDLSIEWPQNSHAFMTGPAVEVFEGIMRNLKEKRESRRHQRKVCNTPLDFSRKGESKDKSYPCISIDISESGIGIITEQELKPGEIVVFRKKDGSAVLKSAIVMWSMKKEGKYRTGLMFI